MYITHIILCTKKTLKFSFLQMCVKENLLSGISEITFKVMSGIQALSKIYEKENKTSSSIRSIVKLLMNYYYFYILRNQNKNILFCIFKVLKSNLSNDKSCVSEIEQKAVS